MRRSREPSRREFVRRSIAASGAWLACTDLLRALTREGAQAACAPDATAGGTLEGLVPLGGAGAVAPPFGVKLDSGLDARLFTDLSTLTPETLVTPAEHFYLRTECPDRLPDTTSWAIRIGGMVQRPRAIGLDDLERAATDIGTCLMECAGNNNPADFGLMSAARWRGAPIERVFEMVTAVKRATRVSIEGFDEHSARSRTSVPGAAWIFTLDQLARARAILATHMNGVPLTRDHGSPVRLFVPGWYGCASVKWVTTITFVDDDAAATGHMKEFAARTHQARPHERARDYSPATIDTAATPVRVEKWRTAAGRLYKVVGIVWGGTGEVDELEIRFARDEPFRRFVVCPPRTSPRTWALWSYVWQPKAPGRYHITLRVPDPRLRTQRLDLQYYSRALWIEEV